ncbi:hypothetical protein IWX50DRAFT_619315 [Phyllosticta citricarpa]|uniref:Uncharacterized protein n=1 Tax=Phyllosticta citricarpa TaxID=55181 RepID=A0ABR1LGQ7_9PEZI
MPLPRADDDDDDNNNNHADNNNNNNNEDDSCRDGGYEKAPRAARIAWIPVPTPDPPNLAIACSGIAHAWQWRQLLNRDHDPLEISRAGVVRAGPRFLRVATTVVRAVLSEFIPSRLPQVETRNRLSWPSRCRCFTAAPDQIFRLGPTDRRQLETTRKNKAHRQAHSDASTTSATASLFACWHETLSCSSALLAAQIAAAARCCWEGTKGLQQSSFVPRQRLLGLGSAASGSSCW